MKSIFTLLAICFAILPISVSAQSELAQFSAEKLNAMQKIAMPEELGSGRLASTLRRYYEAQFGGAENWEEISSIRISGELEVDSVTYSMIGFQKKPNLMKLTISRNSNDVVMGSDGNVAWQHLPGDKPEEMEGKAKARFLNNAMFGTHLLYPYANGKRIKYIDTVPVEGKICHHVSVEMESGFQMDYFLDIRTYREVKTASRHEKHELDQYSLYSEYETHGGIAVATNVKSFENGDLVSQLKIHEVGINVGVIPWIFEMP